MRIVIADSSGKDLREIEDYELDLAFGEDENQIKITLDRSVAPPDGGYAYIDGTEYGGVIDQTNAETVSGESRLVTASGRSWQGILESHRLLPDTGKSHLTVSGSVATVLQSLVKRMGLDDLFEAPSSESDASQVSNYSFERFVAGYTGICAMLRANGLKLSMRRSNGKVLIGGRAVVDYGSKVDSDLLDFEITKVHRCTNHLVCGGTGENENRKVIHFYADSKGNVSKTQSLFGVDEIAAFYDYSNADEKTLDADGKKKLQDMQTQGSAETSVNRDLDMDVGDIVAARDNVSGETVSAEIVKKIVKVSGGVVTYEYDCGTSSVSTSKSTISGTAESSGGGGHAYYAGEGLTLTNYTFAADVTDADLAAVDATATNAATQASNASAAAGAAQAAAEAAQQTADGKADKSHTHSKADITDFPTSMPASDVSAWAKAATKPTYTAAEVGAAPSAHGHAPSDITATIPLSKGGTGASTVKAARYNLFTDVPDETVSVNDGTVMLFGYQTTLASNGSVYRTKVSYLWDYIKTKASSVFAAINHTHDYAGSATAGGAATSAKKWDTPRKITLTGAVNGSAPLDGSQDVTITVTGDQAAAGFLAAHPVGYYIECVAGYDPNDIGGTWEPVPSLGPLKWIRTA